MKRNLFSVLLFFLITLLGLSSFADAASNTWDGTVSNSFASGKGTKSEPYQISDGCQLAYLAKLVNNGNNCEGKYFILTSDIDLNRIEWTPIGNTPEHIDTDFEHVKPYMFSGVFDGRNHSILNLRYTNDDLVYGGLFGYVYGDYYEGKVTKGIIKNLRINQMDVAIAHTYKDKSKSYQIAGICGCANNALIRNCHVSGTINATLAADLRMYSGGIVGNNTFSLVKDCVNYSDISGSVVGGVCGYLWCGDVELCTNYGSISAMELYGNEDQYLIIGGIVGTAAQGNVKKCVNHGEIFATGAESKAGGVNGHSGMTSNTSLCFNTSSVIGGKYAGGISGENLGGITDCYNTGSIRCTKIAGGICGIANDFGESLDLDWEKIVNCYNSGIVSGVTSGALVGDNQSQNGRISNCYYLHSSIKATGNGSCNGIAEKTSDELASYQMIKKLGADVWTRSDTVNNGYPVLFFSSAWATQELVAADECGIVPNVLIGADLTKSVTRGEFAAVAVELYEALSGKKAGIPENPFEDIYGNNCFSDILKAFSIGITNGTSASTFEPDAFISREQIATMLCRAAKASAWENWSLAIDKDFPFDWQGTALFSDDSSISEFARPSVYFLYKKGIINGVGNNQFAPRNTSEAETAEGYANATREQAIVIALRMYKNK